MFNFGDQLKAIRKERGFNQIQFAEALGTSTRNIQYYESNTRNPSLETFIAILDILNVSADYFLCRTTNKFSHLTNVETLTKAITEQVIAENKANMKLKEQSIIKETLELLKIIDIPEETVEKYIKAKENANKKPIKK